MVHWGSTHKSPMTSRAAKGRGFESIGPEDQERRDNFSFLQTRCADSQSYFRGRATPRQCYRQSATTNKCRWQAYIHCTDVDFQRKNQQTRELISTPKTTQTRDNNNNKTEKCQCVCVSVSGVCVCVCVCVCPHMHSSGDTVPHGQK